MPLLPAAKGPLTVKLTFSNILEYYFGVGFAV